MTDDTYIFIQKLWTWLPSFRAAELVHGKDQVLSPPPGNIVREAIQVFRHLRNPEAPVPSDKVCSCKDCLNGNEA